MNARYFHNFTKAECRDGKPAFKETLLGVSKGGATETWLFNYFSLAPLFGRPKGPGNLRKFPGGSLHTFSPERKYGLRSKRTAKFPRLHRFFVHSTQCTIMVSPVATIAYCDGKPVPYEGFLRADVGIRPYKWGADCRASLPTGSQ